MCGVIGVFDNQEVIGKIYNGMLTLQHRGQDSAGILTYDHKYHIKKGNGLIRDIFDRKNLSRLEGNIGIGHTRYPTVGEGSAEDAQPFWVNYPFGIAGAHNGNVSNVHSLKDELYQKSKKMINSNCDVEVIINIFAESLGRNVKESLRTEDVVKAVRAVYRKVRGSYSVILHIAGQGMVAFRDPYGLRPLLFGTRRGVIPSFAFSSETASLKNMGFTSIEDVAPGSMVFIDQERRVIRRILNTKPFRPCIFEYIYFARPDSILNGINVSTARIHLGEMLARRVKERNLNIDVIVPVPDSARIAAVEMAKHLRLKYREGLVKNRYIGRTFIMPENKGRQHSIRQKLNPIDSILDNQNVLLVDDSIVRGNTSSAIIQMVRNAGANKVFFASYSAPLTHPCIYGIDMQTRSEFIAANTSEKRVAEKIGADEVIYQNRKDMERALVSLNPRVKKFCTACFDGCYPTRDVSEGMLKKIEEERCASRLAN